MTPADLDLARRLAAVPGIWRAGMLGTSGIRYDAADDCGRPYRIESCAVEWPGDQPLKHVLGPRDDVLDLDDPATRGALLDVAREMWDDPELHAIPWEHTRHPQGGYRLTAWAVVPSGFDPNDPDDPSVEPISTGPTEGAAIAAAIIAAPR